MTNALRSVVRVTIAALAGAGVAAFVKYVDNGRVRWRELDDLVVVALIVASAVFVVELVLAFGRVVLEHHVHKVVMEKQGRVTAFDLGPAIDATEAQRLLDAAVVDGRAHLHVADNGTLVYVFVGALDDHERRSAKAL